MQMFLISRVNFFTCSGLRIVSNLKAAQFEGRYLLWRQRFFTGKYQLSSAQLQSVGEALASLPLGRPVRDFLDYLTVEGGLSENTVLAYGRDLRGFLRYCQEGKIEHIEQVGPPAVRDYIKSLICGGMDESSVKRCLVAIRMFLRYARLTGLVNDDFTAVLESPKLWQKLPISCSKEQVGRLIAAVCPEEPFYLRDKAILELLYAAGMRAAELAALKMSDLNLEVGYVRCFGKGNKERIIPITKVAAAAVVDYLQQLRPKLAKSFSGDFLLLSRTGRPLGALRSGD